jgi:hypothetical protein
MPRRFKLAEILVCCWIVGAQIWYYSQFKNLLLGFLLSAAGPLLRRIWH